MTAPSAAVSKPVVSKPASTTSAQPIPFRKEGITNTPEVFGLLVTTLLLVGIFAGLAWFARRQGWLDRWVGPKPDSQSIKKKIVVLEAQRISQKTTLYRISNGDNEYLLAESTMQIQLVKKAAEKEVGND
jgi:flagellar biogenesis protein FliO